MEIEIKSMRKVNEFDIAKTYVFSKYKYIKHRKINITNWGDKQELKTWLDTIHECYVTPVSKSNGIIHYTKSNGQPEIVTVVPQECCELDVLNFNIKGE